MKTDVSVDGRPALQGVMVADSFGARLRGLMFRPEIIPILFAFDSEQIHDIHSFFVFGRFDAIYLNEQMEVVEVFSSVPPFSCVSNTRPSKYLLEAPAGFAKGMGISIGSKLSARL